jgi:RNA polymerase sigma factor (sigma-70 family)
VNDQTDQKLLRDYAEQQSEAAFAAIVQRYVDLVYSTALRLCCDAHAAKDVTQGVFVVLAQNARQLTDRPALAGWLHSTARNLAVKTIRSDVRRRAFEQEAAVMIQLLSTNPDVSWEHIAPHLDDALGELDDTDREAVLLRYFKNHDLRTVGATLGISDDAAQKRVSRAVERLREFFAKRGVTVGASGLAVVISANAVQAAPVGLALTISTAAALTGTTLATTATVTATKAIAMTALQKTVITATIAVLAGAGIYEARQASQLRSKAQTLQQQQAALTETIQQLQGELDDAANRVALLSEAPPRNDNSTSELLRLRGEVGRLRREGAEANVPITHDKVESRYKNAQELARNGNSAAALNEFLWCFDEGMPRVTGYGGVRRSYLLSSIAKLGEEYPAALAALRERRDNASQRMLDSKNDSDAALDFAALNRTLKEDQNTLAVFDQLPAEDPRRQTLASAAYDLLVEAQRYDDALVGKPYENISAMFEMRRTERPLPANIANPEMIRKTQRDHLINSTAKNVEVLAGSGDLEHARTLAARLLAYDNSPETKALLQLHANRAGQAGLLEGLPNP